MNSSEKIANEALMAMGEEIERLRGELAAARAESALQPNYSCEHDGCAMREDSGYQEQARKYVDEYYRMKNELAEYDSCQCTGFHTHHHGICTTCKKPVISWQEAHKSTVEDVEILRAELAKLQDDFKREKREHELTWQRMAKRTDELAAAKALLREALIHLEGGWRTGELCRSIRAALGIAKE